MNRKILFRGFCPNEKGTQIAVVNGKEYKGEWVEGCYVYDNNLNHHIRAFDNCYYAVIPETVCEWTGLTDKNGKKIFEGDVLSVGNRCIREEPFYCREQGYYKNNDLLVVTSAFPIMDIRDKGDYDAHIQHKSTFAYNGFMKRPRAIAYDLWNHQNTTEVIGTIFDKEGV